MLKILIDIFFLTLSFSHGKVGEVVNLNLYSHVSIIQIEDFISKKIKEDHHFSEFLNRTKHGEVLYNYIKNNQFNLIIPKYKLLKEIKGHEPDNPFSYNRYGLFKLVVDLISDKPKWKDLDYYNYTRDKRYFVFNPDHPEKPDYNISKGDTFLLAKRNGSPDHELYCITGSCLRENLNTIRSEAFLREYKYSYLDNLKSNTIINKIKYFFLNIAFCNLTNNQLAKSSALCEFNNKSPSSKLMIKDSEFKHIEGKLYYKLEEVSAKAIARTLKKAFNTDKPDVCAQLISKDWKNGYYQIKKEESLSYIKIEQSEYGTRLDIFFPDLPIDIIDHSIINSAIFSKNKFHANACSI
ncbi:MAG: hypothetical protein CME70_23295 [Halobacteriovorax sp.]|nr:hypothetical protein [Halobacteriovorax sp.]|tara:strand:- start:93609 stop:94664 length:1056 start_codon:yes stop_codon:yes gene_type:complete